MKFIPRLRKKQFRDFYLEPRSLEEIRYFFPRLIDKIHDIFSRLMDEIHYLVLRFFDKISAFSIDRLINFVISFHEKI